MGNRFVKYTLTAAAVLCALVLVSCGGTAVEKVDNQKAQEVGDAFVSDLQRIIIPAREQPETLVEEGYVISEGEFSYGMDILAEFAVMYDKSADSSITMIFSNKAFIASRIVFVGGQGYYLRYEYDKINPKNISVSVKLIDTVDLTYQEKPTKWEMALYNQKKRIALFSFYGSEG